MRFGNPQMLWLLLALPLLAFLFAWNIRRRRKSLERYADAIALQRLGVIITSWKHWVRPTLALLATAAVIVATARPQWGHEDRRIVSRGIDLMIAVDTSNSMLAQDYQPNRLERAKDLLQNILWELKGDRVGVMAFAGNAVILCPLTLDYGMAHTALKAVDPNTVATQGTAIGVAIETAVKAFEAAGAGERVLVLLTDGEDQGTNPVQMAQKAKEAGVKIFGIGIGDPAGTPIPVQGGFKQDKDGRMVQSKLDFDTLTQIASITNGNAVKANLTGASEVTAIAGELKALHGASQQDRVFRVYKDRYSWFLAPAIVLLLLEALGFGAPRRRKTRLSSIVPARASGVVLFISIIIPQYASAYIGEDRVLSEKALEQYQKGDYEKAAELYQKAAEKQQENAIARFNLGAAKYKAGDAKTARETLNSVFDAQSPLLNAAAQYNMGVIDHQALRKQIEEKTAEWQKTIGQGDEKVQKEISEQIKKLEAVAEQYKQAILKAPDDREMKANYEIARQELEQLKELLKQQQTPEQQKQQQEQEQKQDEKKDQQQGDKGQDQQQDQKQDEQKKDEQKQDEQKQQDGDKDEQKKPDRAGNDPQKKPDEKPGQDQQPKPEEQKDGEQKKEEPKEGQDPAKATPAPTPAPTPTPGPNGQPKPGEKPEDGPPPEDVPIGEMSKSDVDRLLNSLPPQNDQALQRFFNENYKMRQDMEKDW